MKYILDKKKIVETNDLLKWAEWFESADRHVGKKTIKGVEISTVFLGIDHSFGREKPLLFETMIFGGEHDGYQERYSTYEQAELGHKKAVAKVLVEKI